MYPLPEILENGSDWQIRDSDTYGVDILNKIMYCPLGDTDFEHTVRLQTLGQARFYDPSADLEGLLFRAVESYRINYLVRSKGVDMTPGYLTDEEIWKAMLSGEAGYVATMLMTVGTPSEISAQPDTKVGKAFQYVCEQIAELPLKNTVYKCVDYLKKLFREGEVRGFGADSDDAGDQKQGSSSQQSEGAPDQSQPKSKPPSKPKNPNIKPGNVLTSLPKLTSSTRPLGGSPQSFKVPPAPKAKDYEEAAKQLIPKDQKLTEIPKEVRDQLPKTEAKLQKISENLATHYAEFQPWGTMTIHEPARTVRAYGKMMKKWKPTEEGVFPRFNHRFFMDGQVFAKRNKVPGGTVVIDHSGSMSLSAQQVKQIVDAAPGCTVASYSGEGSRGVLRILAKNGMMVTENMCQPPHGFGNIIDFHALMWAYKLSHPRIWVSDCMVTGVNDTLGAPNMAMCRAIVRQGKFFNPNNTEEAVKILKKLGRFYGRWR